MRRAIKSTRNLGGVMLLTLVGFMGWFSSLAHFWTWLEPTAHAASMTFVVNSAADPGDGTCNASNCTLREAINAANNNPGGDRIEFSIGTGEKTINLLSEPPQIALAGGSVLLNGTTQPSGTSGLRCVDQQGHPCIELNGANAGDADGLSISAGGSFVMGLVINRFRRSGIELIPANPDPSLSGGTFIIGNYIGTDITGTVALGNGGQGVVVRTPNNVIGAGGPGNGNVISGNGSGIGGDLVPAVDIRKSGTIVVGNFIGTNRDGTAALPNASHGIFIGQGASNSIIGGTEASTRNVISGNAGHGIFILDESGTQVLGNYIGTKLNGFDPLGNSGDGVSITAGFGGVSTNIIGGTMGTSPVVCAGACNVISGNVGRGVSITGSDATGNQVLGNYIGTNSGGNIDLGNSSFGVHIGSFASNNTIGGTTPESRNVISGNDGGGVSLDGSGNRAQGNYIGTNAAGDAPLRNMRGGVFVGGVNNTLGGTVPGARNVISCNLSSQVSVVSSDPNTRVQGNYIGTNAAGTAALNNAQLGVNIDGGVNVTIGGTEAGAGNVISGHLVGIFILGTSGGGTGIKIHGNFIGTNAVGTAALPNTTGVQIQNASGNTIGGTVAGARNVISGNLTGIYIIAALGGDGNNLVLGNYIGTTSAGNAALGNGTGVRIAGLPNNIIGGTAAAARNVISGNFNGVV